MAGLPRLDEGDSDEGPSSPSVLVFHQTRVCLRFERLTLMSGAVFGGRHTDL